MSTNTNPTPAEVVVEDDLVAINLHWTWVEHGPYEETARTHERRTTRIGSLHATLLNLVGDRISGDLRGIIVDEIAALGTMDPQCRTVLERPVVWGGAEDMCLVISILPVSVEQAGLLYQLVEDESDGTFCQALLAEQFDEWWAQWDDVGSGITLLYPFDQEHVPRGITIPPPDPFRSEPTAAGFVDVQEVISRLGDDPTINTAALTSIAIRAVYVMARERHLITGSEYDIAAAQLADTWEHTHSPQQALVIA